MDKHPDGTPIAASTGTQGFTAGSQFSLAINNQMIDTIMEDFSSAGFRANRGLVQRFVASLLAKRFVILTGLSGSGKTKLAQAFSAWISTDANNHIQPLHLEPNDVWLPVGAELPSGRGSYRVDAIDSLAVQLSNERGDDQRVRVTLPKELIEEWMACIHLNGFTRETTARTIREQVAITTKYSTQLNSFETHLKAAAFAMLEQQERLQSAQQHRIDLQAETIADELDKRDHQAESNAGRGYVIVAVGADWNTNESILGYPDALHPSRFVRTPALDIILRARAYPDTPHFLILDEMNLSHVERYFADILSSIESGEPIHLYGGSNDAAVDMRDGVPSSFTLPGNLFIIGTVNIDETTYMFSPKVLDRANTIEFRIDEASIEAFLQNPTRPEIESLRGKGVRYAEPFLAASRNPVAKNPADLQARINGELTLFFTVMSQHGYEFGYRTALEITRFIQYYQRLDENESAIQSAIDAQIYQKLLPRLNGSRARLEPILRSLSVLCRHEREWASSTDGHTTLLNRDSIIRAAQAASGATQFHAFEDSATSISKQGAPPIYPLSEAKLQRMYRVLRQNGFTSFAEA